MHGVDFGIESTFTLSIPTHRNAVLSFMLRGLNSEANIDGFKNTCKQLTKIHRIVK